MDWRIRTLLKIADWVEPGAKANFIAGTVLPPLKLIGPRKAMARKNIELVFPGISERERERLVSESYDSMVWTGIELLALHKDPGQINKWVEAVEGRKYLDKALEKGKGVIFISAHISNWEVNGAWVGSMGNAATVARMADNAVLNDFIAELRKADNLRIIDKKEPMTHALGVLKKNGLLGLITDQHAGGEGITVPFFGCDTGTVKGPAVMAWLTGAEILPIQSIRLAPFRFKVIIDEPIKWTKGPDRDAAIRDITISCNRALERIVRRAPGQWLWQHRRFREILGD